MKTIIRKLRADKRTTLINLTGFAASMAVAIVLLSFVLSEMSFDKSFKNREDIYRVLSVKDDGSCMVEEILNENLKNEFPQIEASCRYSSNGVSVYHNENKFFGTFSDVEDDFFNVFDIKLLHGNTKNPLQNKGGIVLTESFAKEIFGEEEPLGKIINAADTKDFIVVAICEDLPKRTSLKGDAFISYKDKWSGSSSDWNGKRTWFNNIFIRFKKDTDLRGFEKLLSAHLYSKKVIQKRLKQGETAETYYFLQPLKDIYFKTYHRDWGLNHSNNKLMRLMLIIAIVVFSLSIFNYVNLATASGMERIKDIGIKKTIGASRFHIFRQILTESLIVCTIASVLGIGMAFIINPLFEKIIGKQIEIGFLLGSGIKISLLIAGIFVLSILSGFYPAIVTLFYTSKAAINKNITGINDNLFRKSLNVLQLTVSVSLIICLVIVSKQIDYVKHKDVGFNTEQLIKISLRGMDKTRLLKDKLNANPNVLSYTFTTGTPGEIWWTMGGDPLGNIKAIPADEGFVKTIGLKIIHGRNMRKGENKVCLINEHLFKRTEWETFEGKKVNNNKVVGVFKDIHYESMFSPISDLMVMSNNGNPGLLTIRLQAGKTNDVISFFNKIWKEQAPRHTLNYKFYNDMFAQMYEQEENYARSLKIFGVIAILISCLGMFGLAEYNTKRRIKEIGVRKVNGARVREVLFLLNKEFIIWIFLSLLISAPLCWYYMNKWVQTFAYRTEISWWIFILSAMGMVSVSLAAVSWQTWTAARRNPVEALRYE